MGKKQTFHPHWASLLLVLTLSSAGQPLLAAKVDSTLYPPSVLDRVQANIEVSEWGQQCRDAAIESARPWLEMTDDQLWKLMFGPGITKLRP